jgi:hypothetical protein
MRHYFPAKVSICILDARWIKVNDKITTRHSLSELESKQLARCLKSENAMKRLDKLLAGIVAFGAVSLVHSPATAASPTSGWILGQLLSGQFGHFVADNQYKRAWNARFDLVRIL